jgi:hypothetical protein
LANYANPFANVVLAALITASKLHPHRIQAVVQQVEMWLSAATEDEGDLTEPTVEYSSGVLSHVAPRDSHEQHELLQA